MVTIGRGGIRIAVQTTCIKVRIMHMTASANTRLCVNLKLEKELPNRPLGISIFLSQTQMRESAAPKDRSRILRRIATWDQRRDVASADMVTIGRGGIRIAVQTTCIKVRMVHMTASANTRMNNFQQEHSCWGSDLNFRKETSERKLRLLTMLASIWWVILSLNVFTNMNIFTSMDFLGGWISWRTFFI